MLKPSRVARLLLPIVRERSRKCANCDHFDLAAGQEAMKANPYFAAAATVVPPSRMGRTLYTPQREDESAEDVQARHAKVESEFAKQWNEGKAAEDEEEKKCDSWKSSLKREVKTALLGEDEDEVGGV